jgi:hypothetical protein
MTGIQRCSCAIKMVLVVTGAGTIVPEKQKALSKQGFLVVYGGEGVRRNDVQRCSNMN